MTGLPIRRSKYSKAASTADPWSAAGPLAGFLLGLGIYTDHKGRPGGRPQTRGSAVLSILQFTNLHSLETPAKCVE
jgi:hypothetical protein